MQSLTDKLNIMFRQGVDSLPSDAKKNIKLTEKKDVIKFNGWKKSIINSLTFLDNDYDLGMPGSEKDKQIFKDDLINVLGNCKNYHCVAKILKKTFKNKEVLDNIMDKAYEDYTTKGLNPKKSKDESTTTGSVGGQFVGPLSGNKPKFSGNVKIGREEVEKIVKETMGRMGADESTTASSAGPYVGTQIWAKNRDNWRGKNKLWKGGKFVSVKEKCKKFPYCNQSPDAIILSDVPMDKLDNVFERLTKKTNKPYSFIKRVFFKHFDIK